MNKRKVAAAALAAIGIALIAVGAFFTYKIVSQNMQENDLREELQSMHDGGGRDARGIDQGLAALNARNPDCIYWLRIPDTVIDYPVMYRPNDKEYYLTHDFNGDHAPSGALYLSEACEPKRSDNLIIYGHYMKTGTMFAHLHDYKNEQFYKSHRYIELETLQGHQDYEVIAAFTTPVYTGHDFEYYSFIKAQNYEEYDEYVRQCKSRTPYKIDRSAEYGQRLLTLSTCEYSQKNGRMVVVAVQIQKGGTDGGDS